MNGYVDRQRDIQKDVYIDQYKDKEVNQLDR